MHTYILHDCCWDPHQLDIITAASSSWKFTAYSLHMLMLEVWKSVMNSYRGFSASVAPSYWLAFGDKWITHPFSVTTVGSIYVIPWERRSKNRKPPMHNSTKLVRSVNTKVLTSRYLHQYHFFRHFLGWLVVAKNSSTCAEAYSSGRSYHAEDSYQANLIFPLFSLHDLTKDRSSI